MFSNLQQYTTIHNNIQQYTTIHNNTQQYTTVQNNTQKYTTIHNNRQQYKSIFFNSLLFSFLVLIYCPSRPRLVLNQNFKQDQYQDWS